MRRPWKRAVAPTVALAATLTAALFVGGCGGTGRADDGATASSDAGGTFPVAAGAVTLSQRPKKIVSLSATATEMLFAVGAGKQVVAVDDQSNYPAEAPKTDLSGFKPNAEAIAGRAPDLVVISSDTDKISDQLAKLKIPVYLAAAAKTLDDSYAQLTDLGKLTGHVNEAAQAIIGIRDGIAALASAVKPRTRNLTYYHELDSTGYSVTSKTFIGSVYSKLGLVNVADAADSSGSGYPQMSVEALVKANPDLIFLADSKCCQQSVDTLKVRPGFADMAAVRNAQVVVVDDDIASRWGPRVVDFAHQISDALAKVPTE